MKTTPLSPSGESIILEWDERSPVGRLELILENAQLFFELGLITREEFDQATRMDEVEWEYLINRESCPVFKDVNIKKNWAMQDIRDHVTAALAAFH